MTCARALLAAGPGLKVPLPSSQAIMTVADEATSFLDTVEGEISFFRSIMRARPVGIHRHFHMLTIQLSIQKETGRIVNIPDIWQKLKTCYNMEALEAIVRQFWV